MKTTDTPESDAAWDFAWGEGGCNEGHLLDVMQKIERERNEILHAARECLLFPNNPATPKLRKAISSLENTESIHGDWERQPDASQSHKSP
jgi:hypothetical protein